MANYPSIGFSDNSRMTTLLPNRVVQATTSGAPAVKEHGTPRYDFLLVHNNLSATDKDALETFLSGNELADDITLTWLDGDDYTCVIGGNGWSAIPTIHSLWRVEANLIGVKV
jgi:hypothetical protein